MPAVPRRKVRVALTPVSPKGKRGEDCCARLTINFNSKVWNKNEFAATFIAANLYVLAERTGDPATLNQTQCSCGFAADLHFKATSKEWLTPMGK